MNALKQNATAILVGGELKFTVSGQRHKERACNWAAAHNSMIERFAASRNVPHGWAAENHASTRPVHHCPAAASLPPITI